MYLYVYIYMYIMYVHIIHYRSSSTCVMYGIKNRHDFSRNPATQVLPGLGMKHPASSCHS